MRKQDDCGCGHDGWVLPHGSGMRQMIASLPLATATEPARPNCLVARTRAARNMVGDTSLVLTGAVAGEETAQWHTRDDE